MTKQRDKTLSHTGGREKTFTGRKEGKRSRGAFRQEVKGEGPLNQHFGPLKLTAITALSVSHTHTE